MCFCGTIKRSIGWNRFSYGIVKITTPVVLLTTFVDLNLTVLRGNVFAIIDHKT